MRIFGIDSSIRCWEWQEISFDMRVDRAGRLPPNPIYADVEKFISLAEAEENAVFAQIEEDRINNNVGKKMKPVKQKKPKKDKSKNDSAGKK